jgi:hypothetical protein
MTTKTTKGNSSLAKGSSYARVETPKPEPIIEKLELSEEQRLDKENILSGKPSKKQLEYWEERGLNTQKMSSYWVMKMSPSGRRQMVKDRFYGGRGCECGSFADYKLTYQLDGAKLLEYYCQKCFQKNGFQE